MAACGCVATCGLWQKKTLKLEEAIGSDDSIIGYSMYICRL